MSDVQLDGMPKGTLPGICDGELRAAAFDKKGAEVEVRWNLDDITAEQAERLALEFSELAAAKTAKVQGRLAARVLHFLATGATLGEARRAARQKPNGIVSMKPLDEMLAANPWNDKPWNDEARKTIERLYEEARAAGFTA